MLALAAALFFLRVNPRMTPTPKSTRNWGAKATFGERRWLRTKRAELPRHHQFAPLVLMAGSAGGHAVLLYRVIALDPWATVFGYTTGMLCKLWYLDRMVWLERDMQCA